MDVCTRVEGHGNINILIQKDEISSVSFDLDIFRGFENILHGKKLIDAPRIASRICGLCHASQGIASCKAIENIYEIEPTTQSISLRRLLMIGELIKSHAMHFFFQSFPDLFVALKKHSNSLSFDELIRYDPLLTSNVFELIKISNEIVTLFGGRSIHLITPIIGGVQYSPSKKDISVAKKYFQKAITNLDWVIERFHDLFSKEKPPDIYNLNDPVYMGMQNNEEYDRYDGFLRLKQKDKILADFPVHKYQQFFTKQIELRGVDFHLNKDQKVIVGPLARFNIIKDFEMDEISSYLSYFDGEWKKNLIYSNLVRLVEMLLASYEGLSILENRNLIGKNQIKPIKSIKNNEGIGIVEAPRGTLIHHYTLDENNLIGKAKLIIATEINLPIINDILTRESRKLYEWTGDINQIKNQAQMIIRMFDPCISCATH